VPIRFGEFVLDPARRELRCRDRRVPVSPQGLQLLEVLIEHRSRVVSKAEILARLWGDTRVSEGSLARVANELRVALGDEARDPRLVRTVHGVGYAFAGDISGEIADDPQRPKVSSYRLVWDSRCIPLREGENVLGRADEALVVIGSSRVSRRHARITVSGLQATLEDLGSKNGTFLGGQRIEGPRELMEGDEIEVGPVRLRFQRAPGEIDTTETG
jgi:DNA-binding winged helix-turn-helix (wHTH) protein